MNENGPYILIAAGVYVVIIICLCVSVGRNTKLQQRNEALAADNRALAKKLREYEAGRSNVRTLKAQARSIAASAAMAPELVKSQAHLESLLHDDTVPIPKRELLF